MREVIEKAREVTGREIMVHEDEIRPGDPAVLVAKVEKISHSSECTFQPEILQYRLPGPFHSSQALRC